MRKLIALAAAAALAAIAPAAALAQGTGTGTVDTSYGNPQEEDDGFPWGLLGLLGLAGLLPRKRHDRVDVDNRTRP
jgi:MYXO-CTERM domain-containing protein